MDGTDGSDGSKPAQYFPGISLRVGPTELEFRFGGSLKFPAPSGFKPYIERFS
jgi:hypothetical protein